MDLDLLRDDVKLLKLRYGLDAKGKSEGRLVIRYVPPSPHPLLTPTSCVHRNECASTVYTTDVITKMFKEEGGALFDSRSASLGHTLQGGVPSPMDRARAIRLSLRCMSFLEEHHARLRAQPGRVKVAPGESAAVITIQGSALEWVPVQAMVRHADMKHRRGRVAWWAGVKDLVEALAGRSALL